MTKSSNQFIKNTILKLLGAIGSEKEINKYIEKFSSPEQRFAVIKVGGSVVENDLENLISSLVFLNQVGLKPVILHGAGPMLSKVLEEKKIDFSFINGQRVTSSEVRDVAHEVFKKTNKKIVDALETQGAYAQGLLSNVFKCAIDDPDLGYVG
jgi:acetylglutamate kinase